MFGLAAVACFKKTNALRAALFSLVDTASDIIAAAVFATNGDWAWATVSFSLILISSSVATFFALRDTPGNC